MRLFKRIRFIAVLFVLIFPISAMAVVCDTSDGIGKAGEECVVCPAGYYCPAGTNVATNTSAACSTNNNSWTTSCTNPVPKCLRLSKLGSWVISRQEQTPDKCNMYACPDGTVSEVGALTQNDCVVICPAGTFLPADSVQCQTCTENNYCPGGRFVPSTTVQGLRACPSNYISGPGSVNSSDCLATGIDCARGTYLPANGRSCELCPQNNYCIGGTFAYSSLPQGLTKCPNDYISGIGASDISSCVEKTDNVECQPGSYLPAGANSCSTCPENSYCIGGTFTPSVSQNQGLQSCPAHYVSSPGSTSAQDCLETGISCAAGTYLPANATTCVICSQNNWCPGGDFNYLSVDQGINQCPNNFISPIASTSIDSCVEEISQIVCNAGTYLPAGANSCSTCPENSYCAGGTYVPSGDTSQGIHACPENYASDPGSASAFDCLPTGETCVPGTYLPANAKSCAICLQNNYCPGGFYKYSSTNNGINVCPNNYVSGIGSSQVSNCVEPTAQIDCVAGTFLPAGASSCQTCLENTYCPGGRFGLDSATTQGFYLCPGNYIAPAGSVNLSDCSEKPKSVECKPGSFLPSGATACETCFINHYCTGGNYSTDITQDQGITQCPDNLISPSGASDAGDCGRALYVRDTIYHLRGTKQTEHAIHVKMGETVYYGNVYLPE